MDMLRIEDFYSRYYTILVRYAVGIEGIDYHTAEDLTQDLFVSMQRESFQFDEEKLLIFCKKQLRNKSIDYIRAENKKAESIWRMKSLSTSLEYIEPHMAKAT